MKFLMVDNSCLLTDKVAVDQRFTQVESPQLIKQNTHYESPAFGSKDVRPGFIARAFFLNMLVQPSEQRLCKVSAIFVQASAEGILIFILSSATESESVREKRTFLCN